ncbi:MAG: NUDIX domain-containing protein [Pseudonocardia sediminis]
MPVLRSTSVIDAPRRTVAGLLRDTGAAAEAISRVGVVFTSPVRLLVAGDEIRVGLPGRLGRFAACRTRISRADADGLWSELSRGPAAALRHATTLTGPEQGPTTVTDEMTWTSPFGWLGQIADPVLKRFGRRVLDARGAVLAERAAMLGRAPVVVGAALVRDGRVLAACRSYPPELAGRWEVPGGGVEAGESEPEALRRECAEELGTDVVIGERVGTDLPIGRRVLRVHRAQLAPGAPEPQAREHRELRWVGAAELAGLAWLDADRALLDDLRALLDG